MESQLGLVKAMALREPCELTKEKCLKGGNIVYSKEKKRTDSAEKLEYEEKKLKMRKPMGENLYDEVEGEEEDARTRRLKLLQATEGDD